MRIVVLGLPLNSSKSAGHASTHRDLLGAMARRGHHILFLALARQQPCHRDEAGLVKPNFCWL